MNSFTRREFIERTLTASLATGAGLTTIFAVQAAEAKSRKMTIDLVCGAIGVSANQREAIELAARHGFESVGVDAGYLASLSQEQVSELKQLIKSKGLVFGAAGLPVEFRRDALHFEESMKGLPPVA